MVMAKAPRARARPAITALCSPKLRLRLSTVTGAPGSAASFLQTSRLLSGLPSTASTISSPPSISSARRASTSSPTVAAPL